MALIDKETIRAEIERLIGIHSTEVSDKVKRGVSPIDSENDTSMALIGQCHHLLAFLDTLLEQPVKKKSNALFEECLANVDPAIRKEVSDNIDKILERQPVDGLEEDLGMEIEKCLKQYNMLAVGKKDFTDIASHFYDLGCRRTAEKYDEIEYNRQRVEEAELSEDLEEEIDRFIDAVDQRTGGRWSEDDILECARHFAEWGAEHLKK